MRDETITVAIDGGAASAAALAWAADRGSRGTTRMHVVLVGSRREGRPHPAHSEGHVALQADLNRARAMLAEKVPAADVTAELATGSADAVLLEHARSGATLVLGRPEKDDAKRPLGQSLLAELAAHATGPVVIVPEYWSPSSAPVIVGLAHDESSSAALSHAALEASVRDVPLVVVHSWDLSSFDQEAENFTPEGLQADYEKETGLAVARLQHLFPTLSIRAETLRSAAADALVAASADASVIVVGTHGRGHLGRLVLGSVSRRLVLGSRSPVVVVPPHASRRRDVGSETAVPAAL